MRTIPAKHREIINSDPYYKTCCLTGLKDNVVKIDIHHAFEYSGRQINELWAYMPVWDELHRPQGRPDSVHNCKETKERVQYLSLLRATPEDLAKYPKKNWKKILNYLKKKYEKN